MLHRVVEQRSILQANRDLEITPAFFETIINQYLNRGYEFVSLDDISEILAKNQSKSGKFVALTFDDGYIDNYEIAFPILKKYKIPFAIYLTTDFPDGKANLWWYKLEYIILNNVQIKLSDNSIYSCSTLDEKNTTFLELRKKFQILNKENFESEFNHLFSKNDSEFNDKLNNQVLKWDHLKELADCKNCTIGSHTVSHRVLTNLNSAEIHEEIGNARQIIKDRLNIKINHFSYPFGIWNNDIEKYLLQHGYKTATTVNASEVKRIHAGHPCSLPRIMVKE
jgi:peptidoglycan/xylan/chitin deacetylase (PgdA/CDA1 family)